jgi:hypothetical protein
MQDRGIFSHHIKKFPFSHFFCETKKKHDFQVPILRIVWLMLLGMFFIMSEMKSEKVKPLWKWKNHESVWLKPQRVYSIDRVLPVLSVVVPKSTGYSRWMVKTLLDWFHAIYMIMTRVCLLHLVALSGPLDREWRLVTHSFFLFDIFDVFFFTIFIFWLWFEFDLYFEGNILSLRYITRTQ